MFLSNEEYIRIMETMPVACIDALVQNEQGEILLMKRNNEPLKGEWWMPGGRLQKGETLHDAIRRKMKQEIGCDIEILEDLGYFEIFFDKTAQNVKGGFHAVSFVFLARPLGREIRMDTQHGEWKWHREIPRPLADLPVIQRFLERRKQNA